MSVERMWSWIPKGGGSGGDSALLKLSVALAMVTLLGVGTGCGAAPLPEDPEACDRQIVTLRLYAADLINPNESENTRPVVVRLYQLSNNLKMQNARYDDILLKDEELLGKELMDRNEVTLFPNDLVEIQFERNPDAYYLGGAAMFHTPQGRSWKTFYKFPPMPNTPESCLPADAPEEDEPQAFPSTAFFVVERKIDNGGQFDETMFPNATPIRNINLPKASAGGG